MSRRLSNILTAFFFAVFLVLAIGFVARGPIEREFFVRQASSALGLPVDAGSASYGGGEWDVHDLSIGSATSSARLTALHATIDRDAAGTHIALDRPDLIVAADIDALDSSVAVRSMLRSFEAADPKADVRFHAGVVTFGRDVTFDSVEGTFRLGVDPGGTLPPPLPTFDGTLRLVYAGQTYPIACKTVANADEIEPEVIHADALPVAAFASLEAANATVKPVSGTIRDLDWESSKGSARLDGVAISLGTHHLHGLHGALVLAKGAVGAKNVVGFLDDVPFDAAGEVHDVSLSYRWLYDGTRELRAYADLVEKIAAEPDLRSVHVDTTAPGIGFAQYAMQTEHGPLAISVLTIDPQEPTLRFDTAIAEDHVISNGERTSAMGLRTSAVAGVNGDYFDIGRTYQPQGMLVRSGEIVRGPVDRAALVIDDTKHVRFDEFHVTGTVRADGATLPITQINDWPAGAVTVITPAFGKTLPPGAGDTFAALAATGKPNRYRISSVTADTVALPASFGIALGPAVRAKLRPGEYVDVSYRIEPDVPHAVAGIGGGPILVRDGAPYEDPHAPAPDERDFRWPVIALARTGDDRVLLAAADGRHPERSIGMTRPDFADLLVRLGATDAMALDSGGSVTMVSRAPGDATVSVRNVPSDNSAERWVSDALFVYSSAPAPSIVAPAATVTPMPEVRPTP